MDEDDFLIIDDEPAAETLQQDYQNPLVINGANIPSKPSQLAEIELSRSSRRRDASSALGSSYGERSMRSHVRPKLQPKLKLKLSEKAASMASGTSFLGSYDRELDSDEEDLSFEEQFILRFPPGDDGETLRKMVASREPTNDIWFKFKGE